MAIFEGLQEQRVQPSLRERKKVALRRRIQGEAVRLFTQQGYDATTVDEIADAADTSASTFYRYFPLKEDVIVWDDVDETIEAALLARPESESLPQVLHAIALAIFGFVESDQDFHLARMRLTQSVPALAQAHFARGIWSMVHLIQRVVVARTDLEAGDYRVELIGASVTSVMFAATRRWSDEDGKTPLPVLMDQAIESIVPSVSLMTASLRP